MRNLEEADRIQTEKQEVRNIKGQRERVGEGKRDTERESER